jgi:hypothetical protein
MTTEIHPIQSTGITAYSGRDLTHITDKLPALYGLSKLITESTHDKYSAGLWYSDCVQQLLWRHCEKLPEIVVESEKHVVFRAPSWSWASVDGQIQFIRGYEASPVGITCDLDIHSSQQVHEMEKKPVRIRGIIRKLNSIRCEQTAGYFGGAERHTPWVSYATTLRTYLDDVNALPSESVLDDPNIRSSC